jgi:hypothetical protein
MKNYNSLHNMCVELPGINKFFEQVVVHVCVLNIQVSFFLSPRVGVGITCTLHVSHI